MDNFYIAFAVYLNLIFIAAKLWDKIQWSWFWVMTPLILMTIIGVIASMGQTTRKRRLGKNISYNLQSLRDLIESTRSRDGERH